MAKEIVPQANEICRISRASVVTGDLVSSSDIRIDGKFFGNIKTTGKLVLGETATVEGKIVCQSADLWGNVKGEIYVEECLTLKGSSCFNGVLKTSKLCVEIGAAINGSCNMISTEEFNKFSEQILPQAEQQN